MATILLITVGGSPAPIITAIESLQPDRTIFICSSGPRGSVSQITGEGNPCELRRGAEGVEQRPNIPTQLGLGDQAQRLQDTLQIRNHSLLAHGFTPITAQAYSHHSTILKTFIHTALDELIPTQQRNPLQQFPTNPG